ncbi:serine protease (plasmid) [Streptomyces sp. Qhu-G9]|uniref:S1 family peptidase n=1 Tax=Streptomyces sp. Qhu-G9 TaxID=3452799 RepID=UPI0022AC0310|nr:serine protease [Streptomyces aurantiacus]WAU78294.1 serine protease [Streptomyces aurantiacus]
MDERRLADVRCDGRGRRKAGSGYLVAPQLVLTARHVLVDEAGEVWPRITVRVGHPQSGSVYRRKASVCWTGSDDLDVALLRLDAPVHVPGTVRWGRPVGSDALPYAGLGYPLQTRATDGHRRVEHLRGMLSPLAGGEGRHDLHTLDQDAAPRLRTDQRQAWGGVSGAAVFCQGHLVGVVLQDDEEHENRRLHALPVRKFATDSAFVELLNCHGGVAPALVGVGGQPAVPSSGYLLEVRELAAERFEGRAQELAAMAAFCAEPLESPKGESAYWRWLAEPWSGKTALMAQFALQPPPGVSVLAFFITHRHGGNSDRTAFLSAMERQLREHLHDRELECRTQGQFLVGLRRAAKHAEENGHCLVLLVDGLDEDTGVVSAVSGHSIAALLPRQVPSELRVLVAGRPNPPVPGDVSAGHPLRSHAIDHWLEKSSVAQAVQEEAERSLDALLAGGGLGEELVALTAAASGGLSAADLAELTGMSARKVELELGGIAGRVFQRRVAPTPGLDNGLFSFAHQQLLASALELLAPDALNAARDRIHAFVARHRQDGWPLRTPDYALRGYSQMLRVQGDTARLVELATDPRRHERLWQRSGGHQAALEEISSAFDLLLASDEQTTAVGADGPDLAAALRLAMCRNTLHDKITEVPSGLLDVWARLGATEKAVALAQSHPDPKTRARQLAELAETLMSHGHAGAAHPVLVEAEKAAREVPGDDLHSHMARLFARIGDDDRAIALAQGITDPEARSWALCGVAQAWAMIERYREATDLAGIIPDRESQDHALTGVTEALASAGRHREAAATAQLIGIPTTRADALANVAGSLTKAGCQPDALNLLASVTGPEEQVPILAAMLLSSVEAGWCQQAVNLAGRLADVADTTCDLKWADTALLEASLGLARASDYALAAEMARRISDLFLRASALADLADHLAHMGEGRACLAHSGEDQFATQIATEAAEAARDVGPLGQRVRMLAETARTAACTGQDDLAAALAKEAALAVQESTGRLEAIDVSSAVEHLVEAGQYKQARAMASAELAVENSTLLKTHLVHALAAARQEHLAVDLTLTMSAPEERDGAFVGIIDILAIAGQFELALELASKITDPARQAKAQGSIAKFVAEAGEHRRAADLALTITDQEEQANALTRIAAAWAASGAFEPALELVSSITDPAGQAWAQASIAESMAEAGEHQQAADLALTITDQKERADALATIADVTVQSGKPQLGADLAQAAAAASLGITNTDRRSGELMALAGALAEAGMSGLAVRIAQIVPGFFNELGAEQVVQALARDRHETQALHLVRDSGAGEREIVEAMIIIADVMAEEGRLPEASEVALQAVDRARAFTDARERDRSLIEIAEVLTYAQKDQQAIELALSIADPGEQEAALAKVAKSLTRSDQYQKAVDLAHTISFPDLRAWIFAYLARTVAERGQLPEAAEFSAQALEVVGAVTSADERDNVLGQVAMAWSHIGRHQEAADLTRKITDVGHRLWVTAEIANILALQGQHGEAIGLAEQITDLVSTVVEPYDRARVLTALAQVWVRADRCQEAKDITTTMSDTHSQKWLGQRQVIGFLTAAAKYEEAVDFAASFNEEHQAEALSDIARALAQAGRHEQAVTLARTITKPEERAEALASIATRDGLSESKRRLLLTEALTAPTWLRPVPRFGVTPLLKAVGRVAPRALSEAAQRVLGELV